MSAPEVVLVCNRPCARVLTPFTLYFLFAVVYQQRVGELCEREDVSDGQPDQWGGHRAGPGGGQGKVAVALRESVLVLVICLVEMNVTVRALDDRSSFTLVATFRSCMGGGGGAG